MVKELLSRFCTSSQDNLTFENIVVENADIPILLQSLTPVDNLRFVNCTLQNSRVKFLHVKEQGIEYPKTKLLFLGTSFKDEIDELVNCEDGTSAILSVYATLNDLFDTSVTGDVTVKTSDISIKR